MQVHGLDILIVDDQPGLRMLLSEAFKGQGYEVDVASNGYEALDKIASKKPALVLLDVKMPLMGGLETISILHNDEYRPVIVLMTAYGEIEVVREAKRLNVRNFISKPFDLMEVNDLVKNLMSQISSGKGWKEIS